MTLVVPTNLSGADAAIELEAIFPDLYPSFRPRIVAPGLALSHHQDPFGHDLCLVARGSSLWRETDSLAWLMSEQLRIVIASAEVRDPAQDEPFSAYLEYTANAAVLVDSSKLPESKVTSGTVQLSVPRHLPPSLLPWLAAVSGFRWNGGDIASSQTGAVVGGDSIDGIWARLPSPPETTDPQELWTLVQNHLEKASRPTAVAVSGDRWLEFAVLLFPEEQTSGQSGDAIVLMARDSQRQRRSVRRRNGNFDPSLPAEYWLIRSSRSGQTDLIARDPELAAIASKHVLLVGCGALGSVVADALARAGIRQLTLVDGDVLDAGNLLRHASNVHRVGLGKATAVQMDIVGAHPGIIVNTIPAMIGGVRRWQDISIAKSSSSRLIEFLSKVDLVVDATAELAVHEVLAKMCRDYAINFELLEATHGAWGGYVAEFAAAGEACWNCLEYHLQDGTIVRPPEASSQPIQPAGCSDPTFTGAGFDLAEIALQGARRAVLTLMSKSTSTRVESVSLRDGDGARSLPSWSTQIVFRHPSCEWHE